MGLQSYYSNLMMSVIEPVQVNGSGLRAKKMAALETKTSKVPTGVRLLLYPYSVLIAWVMRHAWTHKLQLSGPTVHSLYCASSFTQ